jgi:hypothetical protein
MPSNKILTILIICMGVVISVWLFQRKPEKVLVKKENTPDLNSYIDINTEASDSWKDILGSVTSNGTKDSSIIDLTHKSSEVASPNDTTLTAQMAKDFFGRYLNTANGGSVTATDANKIANDTLLSPSYSKISGAVYYAFNLHINQDLSQNSINEYKNSLIKSIAQRLQYEKDNPINLIGDAMQDNNPKILAKLVPMIAAREAIIADLLKMNIPSDAVSYHLALLNAYSNFNADLSGFKTIFDDPVKGIIAINQYQKDINSLKTALDNINIYFSKK